MRPSHISYFFLGSFLLTLFLLQWKQEPAYAPLPNYLLGLFSFFSFFGFLVKSKKRIRHITIASSSITLGILLAMTVVARTTHTPSKRTIDTYATGEYVRLSGQIIAEPDRRPMQAKYTIEAEKLYNDDDEEKLLPVQGKVLVTDRRMWPAFEYGDYVEVRGTLERPGRIEQFHYDRYLSRYDIYAVMYQGSVRTSDVRSLKSENRHNIFFGFHSAGFGFFKTLFRIKQNFESQINRLYAEPHASFMAGLLTGSRKGIPDHLLQSFNVSGLTHIIAISGYNITIVISIVTGLLFWLPLRWRFLPAVIAIALFTLFVGASAAVVRASIMGILGLCALQLHRQSHVRLGVLWTLFFMLCWNPKYLWYDAGFQLSFLAVIGLVECAPLLDRLFEKIPSVLGMREALQMTCAAQLSAVPLILLLFGRLSLIAPIANVLVAPFIPLAMLFGFTGTLLSYFLFPVGQLVAYLGWICLEWIIGVASLGSAIPYSSVDTPGVSVVFIASYYMVLIAVLVFYNVRTNES